MEEGKMECPYCAEEVKEEARICKHCSKDLTTYEAWILIKQNKAKKEKILADKIKNGERKKQEMIEVQNRIRERKEKDDLLKKLDDKIKQYPSELRGDIVEDLSCLRSLDEMNNKEIEEDISKRLENNKIAKRQKNMLIIMFTSVFIFVVSLTLQPFTHYLLTIITFFIAIWIFPQKDKIHISLKWMIKRLSKAKSYTYRSIFTLILFFYLAYWIFWIINNYIEESKQLKLQQIQQSNIESEKAQKEEQEKLAKEEKAKQDEIERVQKLKEDSTKISAIFSATGAVTTDWVLDIDLKLENIWELIINEEIIDIKWKDSLQYKLELVLWDNHISIIWKNDDITKEVNHNIKRITIKEAQRIEREKKEKEATEKREKEEKDRLEKKKKERLEKEKQDKIEAERKAKEEASKLWISYNQVLKNMPNFPMKRETDIIIGGDNIVWKRNYTWQNKKTNMLLQIIWDKNNISKASLSLFWSNSEQFLPLLIFVRNTLPWEVPLEVTGDLFDSIELNNSNNYEKIYWNKLFKYTKNNISWVTLQIFEITSIN